MPIRWKLNLVVGLVVAVFLLTAGLAMRAVRGYTAYVHTHSRVRELADLTASIHIGVYRFLLASSGPSTNGTPPDRRDWLTHALREVEMQAKLADQDDERKAWSELQAILASLSDSAEASVRGFSSNDVASKVDASLGSFRKLYQRAEFDAIDSMAAKSLIAQRAIWIAGGLILLLFLFYVVLVREWLVKPVAMLKSAADSIGTGRFSGRVALQGRDELAQLARHIESMAERLAEHQSALLKARELSAVGELCTSVAHGLRNPIKAIRNTASLGKHTAVTAEHLEALVTDIVRQADRMDERITKLLDFSRPHELHREIVSFRQMALTAHAHVRELLAHHSVELKIDDQSEDLSLRVDCDELAQSLAELASNAVRHCTPGSTVILRASRLRSSDDRGDRLQIAVIDDGAGMSPAEVKKAFDIFYTTRTDGTGMGLAIVRRAVERHGGEVVLESQVGRGTVVTIVLTAETFPADESRPASESD